MKLFRIGRINEAEQLWNRDTWVTLGYTPISGRPAAYHVVIALPILIDGIFYRMETRATALGTRRVILTFYWRGRFKYFSYLPFLGES